MKIDSSTWLFLMVVGLGWWATTLYDSNVSVKKDNDRLQVDNDKQSKLIAEQSFEFNRINKITGTAYRNGIVSKAESQEKIIEYRTILKKEPTCDLIVPQSFTDGVLDDTYSLRASALSNDPKRINTAGVGFTASRQLTYCQAIEWIPHLLADLKQANIQLDALEQIRKSQSK
ncbi:TPA: hypothetical protein ACS73B_003715 [Providencia alcalifaciens]|uniref:hypothetical protein n=1 Tax=Providencia TaxID=586 RepID=UPI001CC7171A|nr:MULTISPECIES: hypothetical protein [Providencia]CAG9426554.1 hypothetical protein NVI2019_NGLDDFDA_02658 [Providencia alcalifaciens]